MIVLQGAKQPVEILAFSPDGGTLVALCTRGIRVWNDPVNNRLPVSTLEDDLFSLARFTPDGRKLLLQGAGVVIHDLSTGDSVEVSLDLITPVTYCGLSPDGRSLIVAQADMRRKPPGRIFSRPIDDLATSQWWIDTDGTFFGPPLFLAGGERFVLPEWREGSGPFNFYQVFATRDAGTGRLQSEVVSTVGDKCYHPVMSADRRLFAGRFGTRAVVLRADDIAVGPVVLRNDSRKDFTGLAFHPSGRYLAATSNDATVKLFDTATWEMVRAFDWEIGRLRSVAFSPDGMLAAAGGDKGEIVVWDVDL